MKGRKRLIGAVLLLLLVAAVLLALGVIDVGRGKPAPVTTVSGPPLVFSTLPPPPPPRRPTRRYFFEKKTEERCDVYSVDGAATSAPESFPCPKDLLAGERIRIVGKTCTLESPDPERSEPVVCPDPLTNFEKRDIAREHPPPP